MQALSASGLRALRYAREVEGIGQVVALDNDKGASSLFHYIKDARENPIYVEIMLLRLPRL